MSTFDRLREKLLLPSPARPAEPTYPAPTAPGPRVFVPSSGSYSSYDNWDPLLPAVLSMGQSARAGGDCKRTQLHFGGPIPAPPDMPAPVLHLHTRTAEGANYRGYGRPAVEGLDNYSEIQDSGGMPVTSFSSRDARIQPAGSLGYGPVAVDWQDMEQQPCEEFRASALDMEQQLEMVAMSLRGDQDEVAGARKGLMMLQPFENNVDGELEREQSAKNCSASEEQNSDEILISQQGNPDISRCPKEYLRQILILESSVLKPDQNSSTWTAAQGITAVCIAPYSARTNEELSLELNDTLDLSFFDASCMAEDWWFAIIADKLQPSRSRLWHFPQDLGLLRKQSGYFPSNCVRLIGAPQAPSAATSVTNVPRPEHKAATRTSSVASAPAKTSPQFSFPILQRNPTLDPLLVPFADVPLWLPTWSKVSPRNKLSPRDKTSRWDKRRESEDFDALPLITSTSDQSEESTFSFTPFASSLNLAANAINDSDMDSPAVSGPVSSRSTNSPPGNTIGLPLFQQQAQYQKDSRNNGWQDSQPKSPRVQTSPDGMFDMINTLTPVPHLNAAQLHTPGTPQISTPQVFDERKVFGIELRPPADEFRTVQIMRNPNPPPNSPAGLGLQFARPRGEMGACHIVALITEVHLYSCHSSVDSCHA